MGDTRFTIVPTGRARTALHPLVQERIAQEERVLTRLNQAWLSMEGGLAITDYYGKAIRYSGIRFEGSPREVYWSNFWEPFIFDAAKKVLDWTMETCGARNLQADAYLLEASDLLKDFVRKTYRDIATTDLMLCASGSSDSVSRKDVSRRIRIMNERIDALLVAVTHVGEAPPPPPDSMPDVLVLRPSLWGIGIDLRALWRRFRGLWSSWRRRVR